jgi:chromosome segregation ATPase
MALFKTSFEKQIQRIERDMAEAIGKRDELSTRLANAETAVADLKQTAERLALDGASDDVLAAAEANTRIMLDRITTFRAALAQTENRVAELERSRDEHADKKLRDETAAAVELLAREMMEAARVFDSAAARLAACTERAAPMVYEATGVQNFVAICRTEMPQATDTLAKLLRAHAVGVIEGSQPAALRQPEAPPEPIAWPPAGQEKADSVIKYGPIGRRPAYRGAQ